MHYLRQLDRELVLEATRQTHGIWSSGRTKREHGKYALEQLERAGPELLRYVGLVDRTGLVASLKRYGLAVRRPGHGIARAVGIGAVFTREDQRGKGLAPSLLRRVLGEAEDHGYSAAFLFSDIAPIYYARLGFVELASLDLEAKTTELPSRSPLELRPATDADTDALVHFCDDDHRRTPRIVRAARSRAMWRYFRFRNRVHEWMLIDRGREVGYVMASLQDPLRDMPLHRGRTLWLDEWCAPHVSPSRVWATIRLMAERERAGRVRGWISGAHTRGRTPFATRKRTEGVPMLAPLGGWSLRPADAFLDSFDHF